MATPAYTIRIGGVDVTENVHIDSINVSAVVNGLDHCTLNVFSEDASLRPTLNQEVEIEEDDGSSPPPLIFGGLITSAREGAWGGISGDGFDAIMTQVTAHSFDLFAKRRVVNESRPSETLKDRITAFQTNYLAPYGVTIDPAQATGPTLAAENYVNRKLNDVFDELSTHTASFGTPYLWEIDADKVLRFYQIGSISSPQDLIESTLTTTLAQTGDVEVEPTREEYANRILLKVGSGMLQGHIDVITANGTDTTFALSYPVAAGNINGYATRGVVWFGGPPNVGVSSPLDIGASPDWTITVSGGFYFLTSLVGAPAAGTYYIEYDAQFPYTIIVEDASEISVNGIVELIIEAPNVFDRTVAQQIADGELARHLEILRTVTWTTRLLGYKPGQRLTIDVPKRNVNSGLFLITEVITEHEPDSDGLWRKIKAVEGSQFQGSWRNLYLDWLGLNATQASAGASATAGGGTGAGYFFFGSVHPQGFQVGPLGALYIRDDGRLYRKLGGGATAYGWYQVVSLQEHGQYGVWATANSASAATCGAIGVSPALTGALAPVPASAGGFYANIAQLTTASPLNSNANLRPSGGSVVNVGNEFDLVCVVYTDSDLTLQRIWIGLDENGGSFNQGDTPAAGIARYAFRYSSAAGDTGWRGQVSDGTTTNTTSAIKTISPSTRYILRIRGDRSVGSPGGTNPTIYFSVDNEAEVTLSGVPTSDELMEYGMSIYTLANPGAKTFAFERLMVIEGVGLNEAL